MLKRLPVTAVCFGRPIQIQVDLKCSVFSIRLFGNDLNGQLFSSLGHGTGNLASGWINRQTLGQRLTVRQTPDIASHLCRVSVRNRNINPPCRNFHGFRYQANP